MFIKHFINIHSLASDIIAEATYRARHVSDGMQARDFHRNINWLDAESARGLAQAWSRYPGGVEMGKRIWNAAMDLAFRMYDAKADALFTRYDETNSFTIHIDTGRASFAEVLESATVGTPPSPAPAGLSHMSLWVSDFGLVKPSDLMEQVRSRFPHVDITTTTNGRLEYRPRPDALALRSPLIIERLWPNPIRLSGQNTVEDIWGSRGANLQIVTRLASGGYRVTDVTPETYQDKWRHFILFSSRVTVPDVDALNAQMRQYIRERIAQMAGLNSVVEVKPPRDIEKAALGFEKVRKNPASGTPEYIPTLPIMPAGTGALASRNWGIEIETGAGRNLRGTPDNWDSKGDGSLRSAYSGGSSNYIDPLDCDEYDHRRYIEELNEETGRVEQVPNPDYVTSEDCYACGDIEPDYYEDDNDEDCVELVSPILKSVHSKGLREITEDLEPHPTTDSAGVHVHVEAKDLTPGQIRELLLGYDHIEHLIEPSYRREVRGYCKRRSAQELIRIAGQIKDDPSLKLTDIRKGDRYVTVNLQALDYHGTVEFRAMGPVYNYDHLVRWAMFCREMVNVAKRGGRAKDWAKVKDWAGVEAMFERFGIEYNQAIGKVPAEVGAEVMAA